MYFKNNIYNINNRHNINRIIYSKFMSIIILKPIFNIILIILLVLMLITIVVISSFLDTSTKM